MQKHLIKIIITSCFFLIFSSSFALAQERNLEVDYPEVFGIKLETVNTQIGEYVKYIFNFSLLLTGFIFFAVLIYGGVKYLTSFGNVSNLISAREQIAAGFWGILVLLFSYLILTTINPQLTILDLSGPKMPDIIDRPDIDRPDSSILYSSIDTELPLGRIIVGRIFDNSRMDRIKENSLESLDIVNRFIPINEELNELTKQCSCSHLTPIGESHCSCDPCDNVRSLIEDLQEKNVDEIVNLEVEQKKTIEEAKQLKFELQKLIRLEVFLTQDCRLWSLKSLAEFLIKVDNFQSSDFDPVSPENGAETIIDVVLSHIEGKTCSNKCQEINKECASIGLDDNAEDTRYKEQMGDLGSQTLTGGNCSTISLVGSTITKCKCMPETPSSQDTKSLKAIKFWNEIDTVYLNELTGVEEKDWATFYCQVGGTTFFEQPPQPALEDQKPDIPETVFPEISSCPQEAPIGEMIDRTKRMAQLLIYRMEEINSLQGQMIEAVNKMNSLVSECSSKKCDIVCFDDCDDEGNCVTICNCTGSPCPYGEIENQLAKIKLIQEKKEKITSDTEKIKEKIGIVTIIEDIVPEIIDDFRSIIWYTMKECIRREGNSVFFDTQRVLGAVDPEGETIRTPCRYEPAYDYCLDSCFLEESWEDYRECLNDCLEEKVDEHGLDRIAWCRHSLNFYCCSIEWNILE